MAEGFLWKSGPVLYLVIGMKWNVFYFTFNYLRGSFSTISSPGDEQFYTCIVLSMYKGILTFSK